MVAPLLPVPPTLPASPSGRRAGLRDGRVEDVCPTLLAPLRLHWCPPGGVGVSMAWLAVFADDTGREQVGVRRWRGTPSGLPRGRGWTLCAFAGASRGSKDPRQPLASRCLPSRLLVACQPLAAAAHWPVACLAAARWRELLTRFSPAARLGRSPVARQPLASRSPAVGQPLTRHLPAACHLSPAAC